MAYQDNTLIVCRNLDLARGLARFQYRSACNYVLASDDPRVHKAARELSWIRETCWIEKMESFFVVASDVIKYVNIINNWLVGLADEARGFSSKLLFWIRQCEGGMTTQRIQDLLLLIRSYTYLLDAYHADRIILVSNLQTQWEDSILMAVARSRGIPVELYGNRRLEKLLVAIRQCSEVIGRNAYYLCNFLRIKLRKSTNGQPEPHMEVIFQLCSSAKKHVNNILLIMEALKFKGYSPVALCWSLMERYTKNDGSKQIRSRGLEAIELERSASLSVVIRALKSVFYTWKVARVKYRDFMLLTSLKYESVPLAAALWPSIRFFILTQLMPRYVFDNAIKEYLKCHNPVGVKIWSEGVAPEGRLLLDNLREDDRPLVFYWQWMPVVSPYDPHHGEIDLFLAAGDWHQKCFEERGIPRAKIEKAGLSQFDNVISFLHDKERDVSFALLNIPRKYSRYILYDPNIVLRGYLSVREQAATLDCLLAFARKHPMCALLVKPHPASKDEAIDNMAKQTVGLDNVYLFDKIDSVYDIINISDVLITKYSTLGIETMFFQKPVISVILDEERKWRLYEDAADYFFDLREMFVLLEKLVQDSIFFEEWKTDHLVRQRAFIRSTRNNEEANKDLDPSEIAAGAIDRRLVNISRQRQL